MSQLNNPETQTFSQVFNGNSNNPGSYPNLNHSINLNTGNGNQQQQNSGNQSANNNTFMSFEQNQNVNNANRNDERTEPETITNANGVRCKKNGAPIRTHELTQKFYHTITLYRWPEGLDEDQYHVYFDEVYDRVEKFHINNGRSQYYKDRNPFELIRYYYAHKEKIVHNEQGNVFEDIKYVTLYVDNGYDKAVVGRWLAENDNFLATMEVGLSRTLDKTSWFHTMHQDKETGEFNGNNFTYLYDRRLGATDDAKLEDVKAFYINPYRQSQARVNRVFEKRQKVQKLFQRMNEMNNNGNGNGNGNGGANNL